ncbi:MAG: MBL fold metallo-hydrolase, partial [Myxococcota bacterium]|nr:MBL fold metallo-hydrolase [Myxococcota bacterium]
MKRFLLGLVLVLAVLLIVAYAFQGPITLRLMDRVVAQRLNANLVDELPDGLHVALCGAGSP